jgi:hypothetical protein
MQTRIRPLTRVLLVGALGVVVLGVPLAALAADVAVGDRVEAQQADTWLAGEVIAVNASFKMATVRLDDDPLVPRDLPASAREMMLERQFPLELIRPSQAARPSAPAPAGEGFRTWSDASGQFKIEAKLIAVADGKAEIERADGKRVKVPVDKLSRGDQDFLAKNTASDNPFDFAPPPSEPGANASPIAVVQPASSTTTSAPSTPAMAVDTPAATPTAVALVATRSPNRRGWVALPKDHKTKAVLPRSFDNWQFSPAVMNDFDLGRVVPGGAVALSKLPGSRATSEKLHGIFVSRNRPEAWLLREGSYDTTWCFIEMVDFATRQSLGIVELPEGYLPLSASPDSGRVLLCEAEFGRASSAALKLARVAGKTVEIEQTFSPLPAARFESPGRISSARFLNDSTVVVSSARDKTIVVWDVDARKAVATIPIRPKLGGIDKEEFILSPDGGYMAITLEAGVAIIDCVDWEHVAMIPYPEGVAGVAVAFSPDNAYLAGQGMKHFCVWDLSTGELVRLFPRPDRVALGAVKWLDSMLLVGFTHLVDLEQQVVLWEFERNFDASYHSTLHGQDGYTWVGNTLLAHMRAKFGEGTGSIVAAKVPNAQVQRVRQNLPPMEQLTVLKQGDSVAIELEVDAEISDPTLMLGQLTDRLSDVGLVVVDQSDVVVRGVCKRLPPRQVAVDIGKTRGLVNVDHIYTQTISPSVSTLEVVVKGVVVHRDARSGMPYARIFVGPEQTLQEALENATKPRPEVITEARIPLPLIQQRRDGTGLGFGKSPLISGSEAGSMEFR